MARITSNIHSIDGMEHPFRIGVVPCVVEGKDPRDLTLVDTFLVAELSKFEVSLGDEGYDIKDIKRIILTHTHPDHTQAANELKRKSGAKIYAHWIEAEYLRQNPPYNGPPSHETIQEILGRLRIKREDLERKFGSLAVDPIEVDGILEDGDLVGRLKVIHSPGHTPGHVALYSEEDRTLLGGDFLFNTKKLQAVTGAEGLFVPPSDVSINPILGAISARRISKLHFDKLLLGHQDEPILENASKSVEVAADSALKEERKRKEILVHSA